MGKILKRVFLSLSANKHLKRWAKVWGPSLGVSKLVAGESISEAVGVIKKLNSHGFICTVDHLGEFVTERPEAIAAKKECIQMLEAIATAQLNCHLSVKLTQLGLSIDENFCLEQMKEIAATAHTFDNYVNIDMEDYKHYQATLRIFHRLRHDFDNIRTVIQAYLYCAQSDVNLLKGTPLRLVKGAYKESVAISFQKKKEINENFLAIIKQHLLNDSYTAVATHDDNIISKVKAFTNEQQIANYQFEFQMLYGCQNDLQHQLLQEGYTMCVYIPYGEDWYGYYMRRLAERPQLISFALRGLFSK